MNFVVLNKLVYEQKLTLYFNYLARLNTFSVLTILIRNMLQCKHNLIKYIAKTYNISITKCPQGQGCQVRQMGGSNV